MTVVEGETVTATINAGWQEAHIDRTPSATTDASGEATFTITAKKKTGSAKGHVQGGMRSSR